MLLGRVRPRLLRGPGPTDLASPGDPAGLPPAAQEAPPAPQLSSPLADPQGRALRLRVGCRVGGTGGRAPPTCYSQALSPGGLGACQRVLSTPLSLSFQACEMGTSAWTGAACWPGRKHHQVDFRHRDASVTLCPEGTQACLWGSRSNGRGRLSLSSGSAAGWAPAGAGEATRLGGHLEPRWSCTQGGRKDRAALSLAPGDSPRGKPERQTVPCGFRTCGFGTGDGAPGCFSTEPPPQPFWFGEA